LIPLLRLQQGINLDEGDPLMRLVWFGIYAVMLWIAISNRTQFLEALKSSKTLIALVCVALLSTAWSAAPWLTLRHGLALVGTTLVGVYFGTRFTLRGQLKLMVWVLGFCAVLSLLFVFLLPSYGVSTDPDAGGWRGVFTHKNSLGRMMLLNAVAFLFYPGFRGGLRWITWAGAGLSGLLVWYSQSMTSTALLVCILFLWPVLQAVRARSQWLWWMVGSVCGIILYSGWWLANHLDRVFDALNRDLTLTGRVPLWIGSYEAITQKPLLGYGYGGFWLGPNSQAYWVWMTAGWEAPHAHNGFLELWLGLGTLGGVLFLTNYAIATVGAVRWLRRSETSAGLWPMVFLIFTIISNLTESAILEQNSIFWILYVAVVLKCDAILVSERVPSRVWITTLPQGAA
jgi:exopolysaccharide production protein ExoQ